MMKKGKSSNIYLIIFVITVIFSNHCEKVYDSTLASLTRPLSYNTISQKTLVNIDRRPAIIHEMQKIQNMLFKKIKMYRISSQDSDFDQSWQRYKSIDDISKPEKGYTQELCWLYYDVHGRVRKVAWNQSNDKTVSSVVEYYNSTGRLCYATFRETSITETQEFYSGHIFLKNGKVYHSKSYYYKNDIENGLVHTSNSILPISYNSNTPQSNYIAGYQPTPRYHNTINEVSQHISLPNYPLELVSFTFQKAEYNNSSFINREEVPLFEAPSTRSNKIMELHAMEEVKIIEIGYSYPKKNYQKNRWYKVKLKNDIEGWMFGGYIEPVEYQLTESEKY